MNRLMALTVGEWNLVLQALLLTWCTGMLLRVVSLKRLRRVTAALAAPFSVVNRKRPVSPDRIAWALAATARRSIFGATCLIKAVAGQALFKSYGYPTNLRVGGKHVNGAFEAHAWLEHNGEVLLGGPRSITSQYAPFANVDEFTI